MRKGKGWHRLLHLHHLKHHHNYHPHFHQVRLYFFCHNLFKKKSKELSIFDLTDLTPGKRVLKSYSRRFQTVVFIVTSFRSEQRLIFNFQIPKIISIFVKGCAKSTGGFCRHRRGRTICSPI